MQKKYYILASGHQVVVDYGTPESIDSSGRIHFGKDTSLRQSNGEAIIYKGAITIYPNQIVATYIK